MSRAEIDPLDELRGALDVCPRLGFETRLRGVLRQEIGRRRSSAWRLTVTAICLVVVGLSGLLVNRSGQEEPRLVPSVSRDQAANGRAIASGARADRVVTSPRSVLGPSRKRRASSVAHADADLVVTQVGVVLARAWAGRSAAVRRSPDTKAEPVVADPISPLAAPIVVEPIVHAPIILPDAVSATGQAGARGLVRYALEPNRE